MPDPKQTPADAPDLGPLPVAAPADAAPALTITADELQAMVAEQVAAATIGFKQQARPTRGQTTVVPPNPYPAPSEPTYEPPFIPTPADFAEANAAADKGELVDEPIAVGATIEVVGPHGDRIICTPKAYRTLYAARGYKAHPEDARRGLVSEKRPTRRRRGGGNVVVADDDLDPIEATTTAPRRRRRSE